MLHPVSAAQRSPPSNDNPPLPTPPLQPYSLRPPPLMHDTPARTARTRAASCPWSIEAVTPASIGAASDFINASRRTLFPSLGHDALLDHVAALDTSCVLVATDASCRIVAAIAYTPFDYRFPQLPWPLGEGCVASPSTSVSSANSSSSSLHTCNRPFRSVEVLRLFVLPQYRRHGLAASLFSSLKDHALAAGVQCMYLHTHPFLPGAIRFWEKQGFDVVRVDEEDEVWRTHHMRMMLGPS